MDSDGLRSERIKAALQEYVIARQELMLHIGSFGNQTSHLRIGMGLIIFLVPAMFALFYTNQFKELLDAIRSNVILACGIATVALAISAVSYLVVFQVCSNQFACVGHAQRIAIIEGRLNDLLEAPLFLWESELSPLIWSAKTSIGTKQPSFWEYWVGISLVVIFGTMLPAFLYYHVLHLHHGHGTRWILLIFCGFCVLLTIGVGMFAIRSGWFSYRKAHCEVKRIFGGRVREFRYPRDLPNTKKR